MSRQILRIVAACSTLAVVLLMNDSPNSYAQGQRRAIRLAGPTQNLPFSDGIVVGNTLYIAGTEGNDEKGNLQEGIGPQTQQALANIEKVVKTARFQMKDIVAVTVYLADIHDFPEMNKVYRSIMPDPKSTRATVQVAGLVNNARIEISAIAVKEQP
ncbi:MAG: RidA family protein [Candidatus Acidiferrales bacterium]|jgi:2-iminobutanoate/2-iminopropanoate deaminase